MFLIKYYKIENIKVYYTISFCFGYYVYGSMCVPGQMYSYF